MIKSYGIPGDSQETRTDLQKSAPFVAMSGDRPAPHYICQAPIPPAKLGSWVEPPPVCRKFYGNDKLDLFTPAEQLSVAAATMTDPEVKLMYDRLINAAFLTCEDPEVDLGLQLLLERGLLTSERRTEIMARMQES